jgi:CxxC-x17-CxxC domain-containing protein
MFDAICDKCGQNCTVPFQPTSGKPIFCSKCFEEKNDRHPRNNDYKEQFIALNHKLDKILRILEPVVLEEEVLELPVAEKKVKAKKTKPTAKKV